MINLEYLSIAYLPHSAVCEMSVLLSYKTYDRTLSTLTMMSLSSLIVGIGRSSTDTLPGPLKTTAFMVLDGIVPSERHFERSFVFVGLCYKNSRMEEKS